MVTAVLALRPVLIRCYRGQPMILDRHGRNSLPQYAKSEMMALKEPAIWGT